ncbi:unnamed protein product [Debaryomyces tyrocola]|nr:unnamed protein product [Debaryomyces tyrocola]
MAVETHTVAGIVAQRNPLEYLKSSPYTIFLFQAILVILLCQLIYYPIRKLQQPKVIAEVVTGIVLGPSVMGHIPNFTTNCFPEESIPGLTLMANIGIILFLFIIGLEVDISFIRKNMKVAISVGIINMAIPFALGCGIAKGIYTTYRMDSNELPPIEFTTYMVFIAVAMCITAFPVLARILTELNLITDRVGTIVLAAGITNDLTGWILLALVVTLANASNAMNTVYILLLTVAWFLFLCFPVRLAMKFCLRRFTNDLISGEPSQILMLFILISVFISAFFTDIIGVHPIFGAFMVGVIVPRTNGYVIKITEKLEDLVHIVLIPIYFALAGLNVNIGLLNRGIDWAYTIGIILLAMVGKIFGGFIAGKLNRLLWRESLAIGVLMSCKGIVEIVVLTVGLNAGIITQRVYSMFIVMTLVTTFLTTPLTLLVYPVEYRLRVEKFLKGEATLDGTPIIKEGSSDPGLITSGNSSIEFRSLENVDIDQLGHFRISKIVLLLRDVHSISHLMSFTHDISLLNDNADNNYKIDIKAVHLREFSSRTSHLLEASYQNSYQEESITNFNENELHKSSSLLTIMKMFNELLGNHFVSRSVLSTFKNHIFTINDQISEPSDLLIGTINKNELARSFSNSNNINSEDSERALYGKLFHSCYSHFGLFITNEKNKTSLNEISEDKGCISNFFENEEPRSTFGIESINLILHHDNFLSASDLLSLHVVYKLAFNLLSVNIFINTSSSLSSGFEEKIRSLFLLNTKAHLSIHYTKEGSLKDDILKATTRSSNEMFVVPNNLAKYEEEGMFSDSVNQLIDLSETEGFNVLVVKAVSF